MNFIMELNDARVAHFFGAHPDRGRILPGVAAFESTAGCQIKTRGIVTNDGQFVPKGEPNLPVDHPQSRYKLVKAKAMVKPVVQLKYVSRNTWRVFVADGYEDAARAWLSTLLAVKPPRKARKRRVYGRSTTTPPLSYMKIDRGFRKGTGIK